MRQPSPTEILLEVPITEERPWAVFAACRTADPDLFFPASYEDVSEAVATCASCPVRAECLDYAIEARIGHGIWGGLTPKERRRLRRRSA